MPDKSDQTVLLCPQCGSDELYPEMGFMTGYQYHCKACDYVGSFVVEEDIDDAAETARRIREEE